MRATRTARTTRPFKHTMRTSIHAHKAVANGALMQGARARRPQVALAPASAHRPEGPTHSCAQGPSLRAGLVVGGRRRRIGFDPAREGLHLGQGGGWDSIWFERASREDDLSSRAIVRISFGGQAHLTCETVASRPGRSIVLARAGAERATYNMRRRTGQGQGHGRGSYARQQHPNCG
jgi:hypothetical protein